MRALVLCAALAACGRPEAIAPGPSRPSGDRDARVADGAAPASPPLVAHGPRLGDEAAPTAYDLTLELDPEREAFTGHVAISIDVATSGTQVIWLHAFELELARATVTIGSAPPAAVSLVDGPPGSQLRGFRLPAPAPAGPLRLAIDYTGHARDMSSTFGKAEEGLFRERADGRWYLFSQAESVFARKIVPCFDEPRWKPTWRLTAIVPRGQLALGNAPEAAARELPDGRREVRFAEASGLPSYLFAVAVGPFALVDAGRVGRGKVPVRIAVQPGDARSVSTVGRELSRIVDLLEAYVDAPLPLAKLDLVAVPWFFGAMENPGLITFSRKVLVGGNERTLIVAHEVAHQWFGNAVTPSWWEDLWLSEGFATWLGQRISSELGSGWSALDRHDARAAALAADDRADALAVIHPVETSDEVEPMFDALGYEKAAELIASFEQLSGRDAFRTAIRSYVAAHTGRAVTSQAMFDALAAATRPEVAAALAANLRHAGTPAVEVSLRCTARQSAVLHAVAQDGIAVPLCVRFPARPGARAQTRTCVLAGERTEQALPAEAGCPAWWVGNDGGLGYYRIVRRGPTSGAQPPVAATPPEERLARGDDDALSLVRGELSLTSALGELTALAATHEPYDELAALAIARAIDAVLDDTERPAWTAWLAARFAHRLTADALSDPGGAIGSAVRDLVVELARGAVPADVLRRAGSQLASRSSNNDSSPILWVDTSNADELFDRVLQVASARHPGGEQRALFASLGAFPGRYAPRVIDTLLDRRFVVDDVWQAVVVMLARGESRTAAWRAIHDRLHPIFRAFSAEQLPRVIAATGALCDATARAAVAAELPPLAVTLHVPKPDALQAVQRALASIDRCIARRAALGDVAQTLAAAASTPRR